MNLLYRYACGCVGRETGAKVKAFIRVAEVRSNPVTNINGKKCPSCEGRGGEG